MGCQTNYAFNVNMGQCLLIDPLATVCPSKQKDVGPPDFCPVGNPINQATGNKYQVETDYVGSGPYPLYFQRFYNSSELLGSGSLPNNWRSTFDGSVYKSSTYIHGTTSALVYRPNGKIYPFVKVNEQWTSDADVIGKLIELTDSSGNTIGWKYINEKDETEIYNDHGRLSSITNRTGLSHQLTYGTLNQPVSVRDTFGRTLSFSYDSQGQLASMSNPSGGTYTYSGNAVIYPDGSKKQYFYDNASFPNALTSIVDENNVSFVTWSYDARGRAISSEHAGGVDKYTLNYNTDGSTLVIDPLGTARRYEFQTIQGVVKNTSIAQPCTNCGGSAATTYDANGNVSSRTDFNGNITTYTHDLIRNLETSRTEAAGTPQARTIATTWHPSYRLPTLISEPGRTTSFAYDASGNLLQKTVSASSQTQTWNYTYNQWGQITSIDGPRTDVADITSYSYDAQGNLASITNTLGHITRITAYDLHGRPLAMIDPNGIQTNFSYDLRGRLLHKASGGETTFYTYDAVGQLIQIALPDGSSLTYTYDPAHRLIAISDGQGSRIAYTLDPLGNRTQENVTDPSGTLARARKLAYDGLGRLSQVLDSLNHVTNYAYDNNGMLISTADANGAMTSNSYDPLGRLIQILDPLNGTTRIQYGSLDQIIAVTDPIGASTAYQVDGLGNVTRETSPDSGNTASTYDAAGNILTRTDATGIKLTYNYDALNRLIQIKRGTTVQASYTWDTPPGKLSAFTDLTGSTQYSYDAAGHLANKTQTQGTLVQSIAYTWAPGPLVSQITLPSGNVLVYGYTHGQPASISLNGQPLLGSITHAPFGTFSNWTWSNGQQHIRAHGLDGEVQRIESAVTTTYSYDAAGRLAGTHHWSQVTPLQNDTESNYILDPAGRLTGNQQTLTLPSGGTPITDTLHYGYDANGNRLQLDWNGILTNYSYSANRLNQSTGGNQKTYTWDAAGRMTGDGLYIYTYNALGRLASVKQGTTTIATYKYNALGQRVYKTGQGGNIRFIYDEAGHLVGEYTGTGKLIQEVVWLNDLPVASLRPKTGGGTEIYYIHPDHLGTPRQITDSRNRIVWRWDTVDAFGVELPNEDPDGDGVRFEFNLRFPGQYYDKETGRHYNYFRDYDPGTGRYTTGDPIGLEGGINRYAYVNGNPIGYTDPFGLEATNWWNNTGSRNPATNGPTNGNWGGKCWSGGQNSCGGNSPGNAPPTDNGDACYQRHDNCYVACGTNKQCIAACDGRLVDELRQLPDDPRQWPQPPRLGTEGDSRRYRDAAIRYFK